MSRALTVGFKALAGVSIAFGATALVAAELLLQVVGCAGAAAAAMPLEVVLARIAGGTMAISAADEWSLAVSTGAFNCSIQRRSLALVCALVHPAGAHGSSEAPADPGDYFPQFVPRPGRSRQWAPGFRHLPAAAGRCIGQDCDIPARIRPGEGLG
jgi:hypothetical protein